MTDFSNELVELGQSTADSLVRAMLLQGWEQAKTRILGLLARRHGGAGRLEDRLERDRDSLGADPEGAQAVRDAWKVRFIDLLEEQPELADELQRFVEAIAKESRGSGPSHNQTQINAVADRGGRNYIATNGNLTVGSGEA